MIEKLLSVKEVAPLLGIKRGTLLLWVQRKSIPHYHINGRPKFRESELKEFISSKQIEPLKRSKEIGKHLARVK